MTDTKKYEARFTQKNTRWKCDVHAEDGAVTGADELFNANTSQWWSVSDFCARYEMSDHDFLCMVAGHLQLEPPVL